MPGTGLPRQAVDRIAGEDSNANDLNAPTG